MRTGEAIQPMIVICKIKQIIPERIFPCNNKESQGKKRISAKKLCSSLIFLEGVKRNGTLKKGGRYVKGGRVLKAKPKR